MALRNFLHPRLRTQAGRAGIALWLMIGVCLFGSILSLPLHFSAAHAGPKSSATKLSTDRQGQALPAGPNKTPDKLKSKTSKRGSLGSQSSSKTRGRMNLLTLLRTRIPDLVRLTLFLAVAFLGLHWRREKNRKQVHDWVPPIPLMRQMRRKAPSGIIKIDPSVFTREAVIINESAKAVIGQPPIPPSAAERLSKTKDASSGDDFDLLGPDDLGTRAQIGKTLDMMIEDSHAGASASRSQASPEASRPKRLRAPTLRLPGPLMGQFEGRFGEDLIWDAPLSVQFNLSGWLAFTNQRIVWITERKTLTLSREIFTTELERRQISLDAVVDCGLRGIRIPEILAMTPVFAWWFPYGAIVATLLVILFIFARRAVLQVETTDEVLNFILTPEHRREAIRSLQKLMSSEINQEDHMDKGYDARPQAS